MHQPPERMLPTVAETFAAIQALHLLGEYDGGTWARLVVASYGVDALMEPVTEERAHALLLRARRERPDLQHTNGHSARLDGIFLARDPLASEEQEVLASVRALAEARGVRGVRVEGAIDLRSIFAALGRAFQAAGARERVYRIGSRTPFILVRETLRAAWPFGPVVVYEAGSVER